ncbi:diphosphate--fructose-6-phosphate 1-phosphotransferase [Erysipelothrix inopinata]|uniref:Pyrophosphate--fructose 6-phosphate 1-phosphotransferase n=1 Tax=Erysipelothrix inopinata TaxID=225084 RepID=A0A7G9RZ19_9FIRM|nr:diphosphate--fructose-6-phosphate 1-phosphotransferase [Erysipelothrix inopinata]QNN60844.1 diphosphate--fructose-6-phosphate 1-phosphotransferase [Erysipelothrix inopinata]
MAKCLVAQSGGPTSVINATVAGVVKANQLNPIYDTVLGGIHGIEGILNEQFVDLTHMSEEENQILRQTPSSALGSCRYKLKRENVADFKRLFEVMEKHDIRTLFYTGGNDSMDTVAALDEYAKANNIEGFQFVGCPKTVDNDLMVMDHAPGFASAAKFIATTAYQTWMDSTVYTRQDVFILETMGRDAGWLAASACVSGIVDVLVLPELPFDKEAFLAAVKKQLDAKNKCYVVVSEGVRYADGTYLAAGESKNDTFGHAVLGGAGNALKELILDSGISERAKVQDLSNAQRSHASEQSKVDVEESFKLGMSAHMRSVDPKFSGQTVYVRRVEGDTYDVEFDATASSNIANHVRNFPQEWVLPNFAGITEEAHAYFAPLLVGRPDIKFDEKGLPLQVKPYYMR